MSDTDKVKEILSRDGSLRFKKAINDARGLIYSNNVSILNETKQQLSDTQNLLMGQVTNPFYTEHDKETIYTYIGKLTEVIVLLENRISQVANAPIINTYSEVDGGRRRKSVRRKSVRRKRKSVRRKKY
jgi:hypothetical protein